MELIKQGRMAQIRALYKKRWDELATVRLDVAQSKELTPYDKERVDRTLKADQEGVTAVLSKHEELYGRQ